MVIAESGKEKPRLGARATLALKLLLGLIIDVAVYAIAVLSGSAQTALATFTGGVVVATCLLPFGRYRAIGSGLLLWATLLFLFLAVGYIFFGSHE